MAGRRSALAGIDTLRGLSRGVPPLPTDEGVLRRLAATHVTFWPGARFPAWARDAWESCGIEDPLRLVPEPDTRRALTRLREDRVWRNELGLVDGLRGELDTAWFAGTVTGPDLLAAIPARYTMPVRNDSDSPAMQGLERTLRAFLAGALGSDTDAWLRLLTAVEEVRTAPGADRDATWPDLLARAADTTPDPRRIVPHAKVTGRDREKLLRWREWTWPAGEVLRRAPDAKILDALMPLLPDHTGWLLALYVVAQRMAAPEAVVEHVKGCGDREALMMLAEWIDLDPPAHRALLAFGDPEIHLALLAPHFYTGSEEARGVLDGSVPLAPYEARIPGNAYPDLLHAAEPELIEAAFVHDRGRFKTAEQLVGCLNLLRRGGPHRLSALLATGRVGPAVTKMCKQALASADPLAALEKRAERELTTEKLASRLRRVRVTRGFADTERLLALFPDIDWAYLEAEHAREPFEFWSVVVGRATTPSAVAARHADAILGDRRGSYRARPVRDPEIARGMARHGLRASDWRAITLRADRLLADGLLTDRDLVSVAAPADRILGYLGSALRRPDAPPQARAATERIAELVAVHLDGSADPDAAWQRTYARLTGQDPRWPRASSIEATLTETTLTETTLTETTLTETTLTEG
ncbi:hypothetical protein B7755_035385 [Streptomyces sp. NBS 14/10]|uniref:hypothetical protein n=1 Tax=Streptomyces sp. NBS 14/10 TaxID=1945643 RepID=UPI00117C3EDC|nr:hypothetical protein [Streptomyces sp. NBS 14/10]KAK1182955.1 hypothetical protein B7755_035385 [Streptomyces sp. NBS 14/10]